MADSPRLTDGLDDEVPRKISSNMLVVSAELPLLFQIKANAIYLDGGWLTERTADFDVDV